MDALINFSVKYLHARIWIPIWISVTFLTLPISSSVKSFCFAIVIVDILFIPEYRADIVSLISTKWCKATLLLFCIALVACLWSPASFSQKAIVMEKYSKLIYLPILVVGLQNSKTRQYSIYAFLIAMIITCGLSIFKYHGFLQSLTFAPDNVFRNHIITSFMVALGAYLSFLFSYRYHGHTRVLYGLLALVFTYQILFVSGSRTGYIIYLLLLWILALQLCTWRQAMAGMLLVGTLFSGCYFVSPVMKTRVDDITRQITGFQHNHRDTDIGLRLQFHDYAYKLFKKHPLLGNGTASFTYYFDFEKPIAFWTWRLLEPHSQYWLVAAEFGLLGVGALLYFFISLIQASRRLDKTKFIAFALIIPFMIGNLSDSLLFYSGSGYFFILFMALCLGEGFENDKKTLNITS